MRTVARLLIILGLAVPLIWATFGMTKSFVMISEGRGPKLVDTANADLIGSLVIVSQAGMASLLVGIILLLLARRRERRHSES